MATKVIQIEGSERAIMPNGDLRKVVTHYGLASEVMNDGDGTYTIPTITDARNPDRFYTKDTQEVYIYEESINAWYKQ